MIEFTRLFPHSIYSNAQNLRPAQSRVRATQWSARPHSAHPQLPLSVLRAHRAPDHCSSTPGMSPLWAPYQLLPHLEHSFPRHGRIHSLTSFKYLFNYHPITKALLSWAPCTSFINAIPSPEHPVPTGSFSSLLLFMTLDIFPQYTT